MNVFFYHDSSTVALARAIAETTKNTKPQALLIFAADGNNWTPEQIDPLLRETQVPVLGAIFPRIIYEQAHYEQGFLLVTLDKAPHWSLINHLSDADADFDTPLADLADQWELLQGRATHCIFVDGLATCIATLLESVFMNFGLNNPHIGGGAGSLSFKQKPCIITPKGLLADVALLIRLETHCSVGVSHGWQPISEPMKVTSAHKNHVKQLDWQPAFKTYRTLVEQHSGQTFKEDNFFQIAKSYPLGIYRLDAELLVRDPLMIGDNQELICVGEVPEGAFVRILTGTTETLIEAAGEAADRAQAKWLDSYDTQPQLACFIDCISRALFLEDQISDELSRIHKGHPVFGALTLGEIANEGDSYLAFYNKTAVLSLLGPNT